jgi:hypothetical protein
MFMLLTRSFAIAQYNKVALFACLYFLLFSFVRTATIAAALYVLLRFAFSGTRGRSPKFLFWTTLGTTVAIHLAILNVVPMLDVLQQIPVVSRVLLRGKAELDIQEIYQQLYRPWLWSEHWKMFLSSPGLMGLGTFKFMDHVSYVLVPGSVGDGAESLPTRLLAIYGLPSLFFAGYLTSTLADLAKARDTWACSCFPGIIFILTNWGGVFHPTNVFFVLFFLVLTQGIRAFADNDQIPQQRGLPARTGLRATEELN